MFAQMELSPDPFVGRRQQAAAQAAVLFIAAGGISLGYDVLPNRLGSHRLISILLDALTVVLGLIVRLLPWSRWSSRRLLMLPAIALAYVAVDRSFDVIPNETYGIWIILIFVWIGMWQPPRSAIAMAPVAIVAYFVPFAFVGVPPGGTLASMAISVPVAALVGETLSRRSAAVDRADADRQLAIDALALASVTDDLTGLGNRRQANVMLDGLDTGDALVVLDLDHFKNLNDTLGHQYGDRVLNQLGQFLTEHLRAHDSVARYGGEEFIMVLRDADGSAFDIVERLLVLWRACRPATTLSAGVALHKGDSWSDTFARADAALYAAKQSGRDRAILAPDRQEPVGILS
jgi:diguanylate cyclase (GGDEF)-like protein